MASRTQEEHEQATGSPTFASAVELALGLVGLAGNAAAALGRRTTHLTAAAVRDLLSRMLDVAVPYMANEVLDRLDLTAVVRERVDLVGLTEEIIEAIDLPEIIRESTGSVASETVRGMRLRGVAADEFVGRAIDRLLLRRQVRAALAAENDGSDGAPP